MSDNRQPTAGENGTKRDETSTSTRQRANSRHTKNIQRRRYAVHGQHLWVIIVAVKAIEVRVPRSDLDISSQLNSHHTTSSRRPSLNIAPVSVSSSNASIAAPAGPSLPTVPTPMPYSTLTSAMSFSLPSAHDPPLCNPPYDDPFTTFNTDSPLILNIWTNMDPHAHVLGADRVPGGRGAIVCVDRFSNTLYCLPRRRRRPLRPCPFGPRLMALAELFPLFSAVAAALHRHGPDDRGANLRVMHGRQNVGTLRLESRAWTDQGLDINANADALRCDF
ncbi:hypothetical protein EVG20_g5189 [Dentipellis fragilis]|uniref:Uncharacterized protein n=1 Tax=Dentipellis fragilis TaxID=205917 RepID=A0A4Y9YTM0_9AGAM|nr:hypothetical protein EVG20_g5189 [Dentipellis fragilis]